MTLIEFVNFLAMLTLAFISIRTGQLLFRGTWFSQLLGVTFGSP